MARTATADTPPPDPDAAAVETLQAATSVLAGVALRSLDVLGGAVTLPQFRVLAVLADVGPARSGQVAVTLGLEASTVTRLADRLVGSGYVVRGSDPGHRGVVMLTLTPGGRDLVTRVRQRRHQELARILASLGPGDRRAAARALRLLVEAAGDGYGPVTRRLVPL
jgi:DNA-binding MarR family transcriptional regulator